MQTKYMFLNMIISMLSTFSMLNVSAQDASSLYDHVTTQIVGSSHGQKSPVVVDLKNLSLQSMLPTSAGLRETYCAQFKPLLLETLSVVVDHKTIEALGIIQVKGKPESGVSIKIPTKTQGGAVYKNMKLVFPSSAVVDITKSQILVKAFVENEALHRKVSELLSRIQNAEYQMMSLFEDEHPTNKKLFEDLYFRESSPLNTSVIGLNAGYRAKNFHTLLKMFCSLDLVYFTAVSAAVGDYAEKKGIDAFMSWKTSIPSILMRPVKSAFVGIKQIPALFKSMPELVSSIASGPLETKCIVGGLGALACFYGSILMHRGYQAYKQECLYNTYTLYMQKRLCAVAEYVDCIHEFNALVCEHQELNDNLVYGHYFNAIVQKQHCSSEFTRLLTMMETNTFKGEPSFFSNKGRVLAAYRSMYAVRSEFVPVLLALSELDVYSAVAQLYTDAMTRTCGGALYTFVECSDLLKTPMIYAENFWNMHIDASRVISNSIVFGNGIPNNIVVTGINRGGKSTIFKSLALNTIFAQAFGIAAADLWRCTPFACISCYLDVGDDVQANLSTFEAEIARALELCNGVSDLNPGTHALLLLDEMFKGSEPAAGIAGTCGLAKKLASLPNSLTIFVSHFKELAVMAQQQPSLFRNYSVVAHENADGSFKPTYTIQEGISYQNDALHMLQQAGLL